jgi:UDP-N-acetylmuramate dehydrogenase
MQLRNLVPQGDAQASVPMHEHTTFRIGGAADWMVQPATPEETSAVIRFAHSNNLPLTTIGNGSNLLVRDRGIRGVVMKIGPLMAAMRRDKNRLVVGAGAQLADVSKFAACANLAGMEFAVGIPGSIGGAVFMNAGAYEGEMSRVVDSATVVEKCGRIVTMSGSQLCFGYRSSRIQKTQAVICNVSLNLQSGEQGESERQMADLTCRRESKQPLEWPSAGSTFKRPSGHFAGTLIEEAGCKGLRLGGAQVSEKHAGFIVNAGGATAADVIGLINAVKARVRDYSGVELEPEVIILGEE